MRTKTPIIDPRSTPQTLLNNAIQELASKIGSDAVFPFIKLVSDYGNHLVKIRNKELAAKHEKLSIAAQAVIDRWETPLWNDGPATAVYIAELRKALEAMDCEVNLI